MAEYLVTVKDAACLDEFYADMEFRGYPRTIRKPLSRSTGYELTDEQVKVLKRDSRVLEIELRHPPGVVNKPLGAVNYEPYSILGDFSKLSTTSSSQSDERQWGHLHHAGTTAQRRYGDTPGTVNSTTWNTGLANDLIDVYNDGKHVDVVIFDQPVSYDHADWISEETGLTRFVQYDWFAEHNAEVIGGLDSDGLASPGSNYVYGTAAQHGSTAYHGTHVCGTVAGRHFGWAREANIYSINVLSSSATQTYLTTELAFDYVRAFHRNKSINPVTGFKNPTIINCSYGSGYDLEETYPSGVQSTDVYGVYYKGRLYDDGITPYDGQTGTTTPVGLRGVSTLWSTGELRRLFGVTGFEFPYYSTSNGADVEDAIADGIVVVKAAGNDDSPRSGDHHLKAGSTLVSNDSNMRDNLLWLNNGWTLYYTREANPYAPGIITVGALTPAVNYNTSTTYPSYGSMPVSFSNRGIDTHVWAAGVYIASVYPPNTSGGYQDTKPGYTPGVDYFRAISGTSMASPQVAGVLACYATGRERFNSADAHRYLQKTSNTTEMFTDNWAKNYPGTVRKSLPIDITANGTDIIVGGQDRARDIGPNAITDNTIRIECLDTLNFTLQNPSHHNWRIVKGSSNGLVGTNINIDDPAQYPHEIVATEIGGLINWTPGIDDVGFYWLVCGCSLLPNHDGRPDVHINGNEILIVVDPPGCWDDSMSAGGSSKRLLQVSNTRPSTGLMTEWCHEKGNRWGLGHAGLELDHRGNRKNRAILGTGENLWPRQNTLNRGVPSSSYYTSTITHPDGGAVTVYDHVNDSKGNLYICGDVNMATNTPGSGYDALIYKLDPKGNLVASIQHNPSANGESFNFSGIACDDEDNIYVHGHNSTICKYNSNLELQYDKRSQNSNAYGKIQSTVVNGCLLGPPTSGSLQFAGDAYGSNHTTYSVDPATGDATSMTYATPSGGNQAYIIFYGSCNTGGQLYMCGKHVSPNHSSDACWIANGGSGNSNSYKFYFSGTNNICYCIAKDTTNNRTYIAGDVGGNMRIMRVDSYNTTAADQGSVWWKSGPTGDILDIALGTDNLPRFITSTGHVVKMNESGTVLWAKDTGFSGPKRLRIDSAGDMWIAHSLNNATIQMVKTNEDGDGLNTSSMSFSTVSYSYSDQSYVSTGAMLGSANGMSQWGGVSTNNGGGTTTTISPTQTYNALDIIGKYGYLASGEAVYDTAGTYQWTCPTDVRSVSVVAVGAGGNSYTGAPGGGGGGGLGYKNNISVTPGQTYTVVVGANVDNQDGGDSYFIDIATVKGGGGQKGKPENQGGTGGTGGNRIGDGGGNGGDGGTRYSSGSGGAAGGGGAGGYSGDGGAGGNGTVSNGSGDSGSSGAGGGGGGGCGATWEGGSGGGVRLYGEGVSGVGGSWDTSNPAQFTYGYAGYGGSGAEPQTDTTSPTYTNSFGAGSGGGAATDGSGGTGAGHGGSGGGVRIIWGPNRSFPYNAAPLS